jgi:hypothetical protein
MSDESADGVLVRSIVDPLAEGTTGALLDLPCARAFLVSDIVP